ncbi:MAG: peroxidase family protein [Flavisolibacter sp.]
MIVRSSHGSKLPRGLVTTPKSQSFDGSFGRMFRTLPSAIFDEASLEKLAAKMVADFEAKQTGEDEVDDEENQGIDAGYTYLGQFIDHDLTFDPSSSLQKTNDPEGLLDYRTPRFDLDNLYGRGPDDQPYLYDSDGLHFLLGKSLNGNKDQGSRDLLRNGSKPSRAIIGDPRNDENVIVSQLQGIFLRFHNKMVDLLKTKKGDHLHFSEVQQAVRWHYQWVVLHDFLPTIVGEGPIKSILPNLGTNKCINKNVNLQFYKYKKEQFIPIEFSVAAYRFGHSMVRPIYRLNQNLKDRFMIFAKDPILNLQGFREFPSEWAIDWDLFFNPGNAPQLGIGRIQKAYKIDTSLVNPLGELPPSIASTFPSLALRNLLRGRSMGLPSGQAVACYMEIDPIDDDHLKVGKANKTDTPTNPKLVDISGDFKNNAPLWYYILAEAQQQFDGNDSTPITLGPVGGKIVAEVFIGLMLADSHSFLVQNPTWKPRADFMADGKFKMKDLIRAAIK